MDVRGLLLFLVLGLPTAALAILKEIYVVNQPKEWTEAQSYCREKFTDLVTVENADDWTRMYNIFQNSGHGGAWIGMYDDVKSWRWSLDDTSLYERDLGTWFVFNEDNYLTSDNCADIYQGELRDFSCEATQTSVCYDGTSNSYIPVADAKTWQSAQSFCRETYTDLASIRNQQELNDIMSVVDSSQHYWVGLSRDGWKWSDQRNSSFRQWKSGEPDDGSQICGLVRVEGMCNGWCYVKLPFICSVTVTQKKVFKVTLKTDGSVNLNDPLVQEALVKQMEKDLRGQVLHQEFSLRWKKQPHGYVFNKTEL